MPSVAPIRVVVADDHPSLRAGIRAQLEKSGAITVVGEASSGEEALRLVRSLDPNVLLIDMEMPGLSGIEVTERLVAEGAPTRILAFSAYDDQAYVTRMLEIGAAGYITKDKDPALVVEAVQAVARGEGRWFVSLSKPEVEVPLSEREIEVLGHMAKGLSNEEIAKALFISPNTVRNHVASVYSKLDVHSWREAVAWAWQRGLVGGG